MAKKVEGMEKVIASVTGYHGTERWKLILLITATGGHYVGRMSKAITHLVCWGFDGEKYKLAKKFGTIVVNHQWFEDCMKEGKRIPEHPYTMISGQDAGFIRYDVSILRELARPSKKKKHHKDETVRDYGEKFKFDFDTFLEEEDLLPRPGTQINGTQMLSKKTSQGNRQADNTRSNYEASFHTVDTFQSEDLHHFPKCSNKQRWRNPYTIAGGLLGESSRGRGRLHLKNARKGTTRVATIRNEIRRRVLAVSNGEHAVSNLSSSDSNDIVEGTETYGSSRHVMSSAVQCKSRHIANHMNDVGFQGDKGVQSDYVADADRMNLHECSSNYNNSKGEPKQNDSPGDFAIQQKSAELSCVICWTDFSSTRGVLSCGHRFCLSCIQNWADIKASFRKKATCPLCNTSFASITRVDGSASLDQKIYSQTVPCAQSSQDLFLVSEGPAIRPNTQTLPSSVCCQCHSHYPADLLIKCHICQTNCIHYYCIDPPGFPWTCLSCGGR